MAGCRRRVCSLVHTRSATRGGRANAAPAGGRTIDAPAIAWVTRSAWRRVGSRVVCPQVARRWRAHDIVRVAYLITTAIMSCGLPLVFCAWCGWPRPMNRTSPRFHVDFVFPPMSTEMPVGPVAIST